MKIGLMLALIGLLPVLSFGCLPDSIGLFEFHNTTDVEVLLRVEDVPADTTLPVVPLGDAVRASNSGCGVAQAGQPGRCGVGSVTIGNSRRDDAVLLVTAFSKEEEGEILYQGLFEWEELEGKVLRIVDQR